MNKKELLKLREFELSKKQLKLSELDLRRKRELDLRRKRELDLRLRLQRKKE